MTSCTIFGGHILKTVVIVAMLVLFIGDANAAIWTVDDNGGANYSTIQDAIDNASTGDTIRVYSGTYNETVNVDEQLILVGVDTGEGQPEVNAGGNGSAITLSENGTSLKGFKATNSNELDDAGIKVISNNNSIKDNDVLNNTNGIYLFNSNNNSIVNNTASSNLLTGVTTLLSAKEIIFGQTGIFLESSNNNSIIGNNVSKNGQGIYLLSSRNNTISNNTASDNDKGIYLYSSNNNNITNNTAFNNSHGFSLWVSGNLNLSLNNAFGNDYGIHLVLSDSCTLIDNTASNNKNGIFLDDSKNNILKDNRIFANDLNFGVEGNLVYPMYYPLLYPESYQILANDSMAGIQTTDDSILNILDNDIDTSNLVDGKPIYYLVGSTDRIINSSTNAGTVYCIKCTNIEVEGLTLNNNSRGIYFYQTTNSSIKNNSISNNTIGIKLWNSSNNNITGNNVITNVGGIEITDFDITDHSDNNTIFYNNFINNSQNAFDDALNNSWDNGYPSCGNFWSDYTGADNFSGQYQNLSGSDGIGDEPYNLSGSTGAVDRYPFMVKSGWISEDETDVVEEDDVSTSSGGGGGGGGTSGEAFENILVSETEREYVNQDAKVSYSFDMDGNTVRYINFTPLISYGQVAAKVEMLKNTSTLVDQPPSNVVYMNLNIWVGNLGWANSRNIAGTTVNFMVEKSWVTENNIDESTIRLYRYNDGIWNPLVTTRVGFDEDYLYFEAETPGFSPFAVTGREISKSALPGGEGIVVNQPTVVESIDQTDIENKPGIPGFSLFSSGVVLLVVVLMLQKKK